jgi:hypothetical protein
MTTTEKRGFRLPWGGDGQRHGDEPDPMPGDSASAVLTPATDLAPAIAPSGLRSGAMLRRAQAEELGRGPFDLAPADESDDSSASESLVDVVEPASRPKRQPVAETTEVLMDEPDAEGHGTGAAHAAPASPAAATAWPEIDRRDSPTHLASDAPLRPAVVVDGAPRKVNPLMAGLVKAMRDAARAAREETTARMRADAAARAEEIRLEAVAAGMALKKHADEDVAAIREWSRTEAARIKQETETQIAERKARLVSEAQAHATATEHLNGELKQAISAFETEMERFFDALLREEDPARLATLAERLPEAPTFARLGDAPAPARAPRAPRSAAPRKTAERKPAAAKASDSRLAPDAAAAAEAEAILGLDDEPAAETLQVMQPAPGVDAVLDPAPEPVLDPAPEAVLDAPATDADHDTNGHVAPTSETTDDADSLAAWADALAAIRARANDADDAVNAADSPVAASEPADAGPTDDPGYVDTFEAPADSLLGVLNGASRINSPDDLSPEERIALLGFDEPAPGDEPAPMTAMPVEVLPTEAVTRVVVSGLASVPEISAFKTALVGVPGVISVSVTSGHEGDFVFSVLHATTTDLRAAVPGFGRFAPHLTADEAGVLTFALGDPA